MPHFPNLGWVARVLTIISAFSWRKYKEKGSHRQEPAIFYRFLEAAIGQFYLYLIGHNLVTWSHVVAREAGKLSLFQTAICSAKIWAFSWRKENGY